eukprot:gene15692-21229_t
MDSSYGIDESKDYYLSLGLKSTASIDELKAAYVHLALMYHPDTASNQSKEDHASKFIDISEAWGILSKPELKVVYDKKRKEYLRLISPIKSSLKNDQYSNNSNYIPASSDIPVGLSTQISSFAQKKSTTDFDGPDRYQSEKWRKLPLEQRKNVRSLPLKNPPSIGAVVVVVGVVLGFNYLMSN